MGFFSKIWKGIKKGVKSIGKGIKSALSKVGKFMDKIGIVGQIALMFILPGVGTMLSQGVGALAASTNPLLAGVGNVLQTVGKFASTAGNAFKTVTDGITSFVSNVGKGFVNQVGSTFGAENLIFPKGPATVSQGFSKWMQGVSHDAANITSPFRAAAAPVTESVASAYEKTFQQKVTEATKINIDNFAAKPEKLIDINSPFSLELKNPQTVSSIVDLENKTNGTFFSKISDFTRKNMEDIPQRALDTFSDQFSSGVASSALSSAGLGPEPPTYVQNVTNIPKFDSAPVSQAYETNGFNYGALPDNRLQFFAAQNAGGDFGMSSFQNFSRLRG